MKTDRKGENYFQVRYQIKNLNLELVENTDTSIIK